MHCGRSILRLSCKINLGAQMSCANDVDDEVKQLREEKPQARILKACVAWWCAARVMTDQTESMSRGCKRVQDEDGNEQEERFRSSALLTSEPCHHRRGRGRHLAHSKEVLDH